MVGTETPNYLKPKGNSAVSPDWEIQEWMWLWEGSGRKRFWLAWLGSGAIPWANQCGQYQFSHSVVSNSLRFHGLQHARLPCPSPPPRNLLKLMSIESVMPSNNLILCHPPSPPAFNLSQHQGLFKWVSSSHQVAKVLELLHHQFFSEYSGLISFRFD